jgi:hypothetical protein
MAMPSLRPIGSDPIAIRRALEEGWEAFCRQAWTLMGFTLIAGGLNVLSWLVYRHSGGLLDRGLPQTSTLQLSQAALALLAYVFTAFWLLSGLIRGSEGALEGRRLSLLELLRMDGHGAARLAWTSLFLLLLLTLVLRAGDVSSWALTLLLPRLAELPLWAARAVVVYVLADQVLMLPITVLGGQAGLAAFRSGRRATDPHWLHALGLMLAVALILLAGFLLLVGLVAALPWALCSLTAAYRQLFILPLANARAREPLASAEPPP